ncbi:MAG: alpha/beta hydrolase family protein [Pyrinomonadaceae bacterium]
MKIARIAIVLLALFIPYPVCAQRDPPTSSVNLQSKLLGRTVTYQILIPIQYQYEDKAKKLFPVVYLLHGVSGHSNNWLQKTSIAMYANPLDVFVVMVEGGDGWYTDSATVPEDKFESYILQELIPDVESRYRVQKSRAGRAIAGLSMGGYGAIKFGLKYPDKFVFAGSMSGAFGAASWNEKELQPGVIRDSVLKVFGPADSATRRSNDIFKLVREWPADKVALLPYLYFDSGTEDRFFKENRDLAYLLTEKKIPHEYRELPGNHSWTYWNQQLDEILRIAARKLDSPVSWEKSGGKPAFLTAGREH